jgi:hypothetical protein
MSSPDIGDGAEKVVEKHSLALAFRGREAVREAIEPASEARRADFPQILHRILTSRRHGLCPFRADTAFCLFHI